MEKQKAQNCNVGIPSKKEVTRSKQEYDEYDPDFANYFQLHPLAKSVVYCGFLLWLVLLIAGPCYLIRGRIPPSTHEAAAVKVTLIRKKLLIDNKPDGPVTNNENSDQAANRINNDLKQLTDGQDSSSDEDSSAETEKIKPVRPHPDPLSSFRFSPKLRATLLLPRSNDEKNGEVSGPEEDSEPELIIQNDTDNSEDENGGFKTENNVDLNEEHVAFPDTEPVQDEETRNQKFVTIKSESLAQDLDDSNEQ